MLKIQKRLNVPARAAHVLLRELLVHGLGWAEVFSSAGTGSFGLVASGTDGDTSSDAPTTFNAASGAFNATHIGKYLVLGGANTPFDMKGLHRITGVSGPTSITVTSGLYGSRFSTALSIPWRVVDPTLNTDITEFVVQGLAGTGTPAWQARFRMGALDTDAITIDVGPWGGYSAGTWMQPVTASVTVANDTTPLWDFLVDDASIRLFTEKTDGSGVHGIGYAGTGLARRPDVDDHFAVCSGGTPTSFLSTIQSIASNDTTPVVYSALQYRDDTGNQFSGMPNSPFDLRRDVMEVAIGCTAVGHQEADRGVLRGVQTVSSLINYRSFVDNGRQWVSLGNTIAFAWDGSVST